MPTRINPEGLLEILHPETGAYVPASALLQVEGGWLAALVPNQVAILSDIQNATTHLQLIENVLINVQSVLAASDTKLAQSNTSLNLLPQVNTALGVVNNAIDSLETLGGNTNALLQSLQSKIDQLSGKLPATLGTKIGDSSLSVALSTDSAIFASLTSLLSALSAGGSNTAYNELTTLSGKIPTALGARLRAESLSVALATDSAIFTSLTSLLAALSDGVGNSVYSTLTTLSSKLPASVGGKLNASSLSVALATDSTIFTSLTSILGALSTGGTNTAISRLAIIANAQYYGVPIKSNGSSPIINAATAAVSSIACTMSTQAEFVSLQNFFSIAGASAQFSIELRVIAGATTLSDKTYYYRGDVASPFTASVGAIPGESPIIIPTYGHAQVVVHLVAIAGGGNVTTFIKEIK